MAVVHRFDPPERFVAGTVGPPGQRAFFLQARAGRRLTSVALEKQQVAALAERIDGMLDELMTAEATRSLIPAVAPLNLTDNEPLEQPIEAEFRAGTMTLSFDPTDERVVIEVFPIEASDEDEDDEAVEPKDPEELLVVRLSPADARAFVQRSTQLVNSGRPSCPFCGNPIDPEGHLCVRANGFHRRHP